MLYIIIIISLKSEKSGEGYLSFIVLFPRTKIKVLT